MLFSTDQLSDHSIILMLRYYAVHTSGFASHENQEQMIFEVVKGSWWSDGLGDRV